MLELNNKPTSEFPYILLEKIGEGGMGLVYRAVEPALERKVAIKFLHPHLLKGQNVKLAKETRQRFVQEARAAAVLSHPGVVTVFRIGSLGSRPYIAMEWLEGQSLDEVLDQGRKLGAAEVVRLGGELLDALDAAHGAGVVHRDIKPTNIMILGDSRLKVMDFGIARVKDSALVKTEPGFVMATVPFASPDHFKPGSIDPRADLYAVGMVLYVALAGRHPFEGQTVTSMISSVLHVNPEPIHESNPLVSKGLSRVIHRALAKNPEERYATAAQMAADLRASLGPEPDLEEQTVVFAQPEEIDDSGRNQSIDTLIGLRATECCGLAEGVFRSWAQRDLGRQAVPSLLHRLSERPLHAPAYSGGARVGSAWLLFHEGELIAAFDTSSTLKGDLVLEALPESAEVCLAPLPEGLPVRALLLLGLLVETGAPLHSALDSSFVDLGALAKNLQAECFDGVIRLSSQGAIGVIVLERGQTVLQIYSEGWEAVPLDQPWQSWVSDIKVRADVDTLKARALFPSFRIRLADHDFALEPRAKAATQSTRSTGRTSTSVFGRLRGSGPVPFDSSTRLMIGSSTRAFSPTEATPSLDADPSYRFLDWMLKELPDYLRERKRLERWQYLAGWIPLARRAKLHHRLPRRGSEETDFFDLVTFDENDKVLHVAQRFSQCSVASLNELVSRVMQAKKARTKGGDIRGAMAVAPAFDPEVLHAYADGKDPTGAGTWEMALSESLTGHQGFVRLGARRGFHLLLVKETKDGFLPILPDAEMDRFG